MIKNWIEHIKNFFSDHKLLNLGRLFLFLIVMLINAKWSNAFTIILFFGSIIILFLENLLIIPDKFFNLTGNLIIWAYNNKKDIHYLPIFLLCEIFFFLIILAISALVTYKFAKPLNDIYILNSPSASLSVICFIFLLILLVSTFILNLLVQTIYFKLYYNALGYKIIDYIFIFVLSIAFVFIIGFNTIVYEYIEINKNFFIKYFENLQFNEVAITVKSLYSLTVYGLFSILLSFHTSTKIASTITKHSMNSSNL